MTGGTIPRNGGERLWPLLAALAGSPLLLFPDRIPLATAIALLALLILLLLTCRPWLPATPLNVPLTLYLAFSALAFLVSPLPADSLRRLTTLFLGVVIFFLLFRWLQNRPSRLYPTAQALAFLATLIALGSLFALEWPARYLLDLTFLTSRLPHLTGPVTIHHNQMAGILLLLLPLAAVAYQQAPTPGRRLLSAASLAAILLAFTLTQSRNGWLALLVAGAGALLWRRRRSTLLMALLLLLFVLPFVFAYLPASSPVIPALDQVDASTKLGAPIERSWVSRLEMWTAAVKSMVDYPLLGAGLYTFDPVSRANYVYEAVHPSFPISHAHNLFLHTGAGLGWPGWLAAVLLWLSLIYGLWRSTGRAPAPLQPIGLTLGAAFLAYLSFNTWDILALEQRAGLLIWPLIALATAYGDAGPALPGRRWRLLQAAPLALFLLLLPTLPRNLAHLRLDHARLAGAPGHRLAPQHMGDPRRQGLVHYLQGDDATARRYWARDPQAVPFLINQGQQAYMEGQTTAAVSWYDQALALDPSAAIAHYWRGLAHETLGKIDFALADYSRAVTLTAGEQLRATPLKAVAWDRQGRLLAQKGDWRAAAEAFARASALAPQVDDYRQRLHDVRQLLPESNTSETQ